jgi:sec-independent protein translocase protein TatA
MLGLQGWEILIVLVLGLVLFGARKLPELGKGLGQGIREFRKASKDIKAELEDSFKEESPKTENKA